MSRPVSRKKKKQKKSFLKLAPSKVVLKKLTKADLKKWIRKSDVEQGLPHSSTKTDDLIHLYTSTVYIFWNSILVLAFPF
jgi:hypothetical protein